MRKTGINILIAIAIVFASLGAIGSESENSLSSSVVSAKNLDVDGNEEFDALTDGLLILRSMFGLTGAPLVSGAVSSNALYTNAEDIEARILSLGNRLDVDNNGNVDALTDGLIILRYLFGLTGDFLTNGVVASDAERVTAAAIEEYVTILATLNIHQCLPHQLPLLLQRTRRLSELSLQQMLTVTPLRSLCRGLNWRSLQQGS